MFEDIWRAIRDELSGERARGFTARLWETARWNSFDKLQATAATVADIIAYRMRTESFVHKAAETVLPTPYGEFKAMAFVNDIDDYEHLALVKGEISPEKEVLVRVHSQCLTGDVFGSYRCDCGEQLRKAMEM